MNEKKIEECINYLSNIRKEKGIEKLEIEKYIKKDLETIEYDGYLLRLDIDNLRGINAARGNSHGDVLIEYTHQCISHVLDPQQKVYCLSGGEFIIISPKDNMCSAETLYKKIQQEITNLIIKHEYCFSFSVCGGIFYVDGTEITFDEILKCSEFTLETAKKKGPNEYYSFCIKDYYERVSNHHLKLMLQKAVNDDFDGFIVNFQPIANHEGQIRAAEALLRFQKDDVTINPGLLIDLLEETGLIILVGRWTLKKALEFCNHVRIFDPKFVISVNMSYIEASDYTRLDYILETLEEFEVPAGNLSIELTESGLLETDKNIQHLWQGLKKAGVFISLDDFGTGFSNFHYIEDIKPDLLKVDYIITQQAMQSERHFKILEAINSVVQHLDLKLCVEGIEDREVFDKMKKLGASFYQGYHFSKPCTSDEFINKFFAINMEEEENQCPKNN
ncbi:diguanylate cyclase (GGDEF) domain-containing protein [Granulicatella balaenopterae]|uniref:Diguanylate cyclase (GGDEF) domain-containing protein n=1 Tax=Granulicatella balaenopterae TaxID=137733 RepID=A0A1H9KXJ9_9LACT|nr:GGDEF domain-containing phosphodiesterase [Granulicatella balaenopterae]SER03890.1 diguanylate cyclase (GGDEF) domain-containing protein [Granulicatella balaenopterae]